MANVEMPQLGETVTEGTITRWFKQVGDSVAADEVLFEVSTDKVDSEVPSPFAGVLTEIKVPEGETVEVGVVLAVIGDADAQTPSAAAADPDPVVAPAPPPATAPPAAPAPAAPTPASAPVPAPAATVVAAAPAVTSAPGSDEGRLLSPVVRRLIRENNLDSTQITGTGVGGRITRKDVLDAIDAGVGRQAAPAAPAQAAPTPTPAPAQAAPTPAPAPAAPTPQPVSAAPVVAATSAVSPRSEYVAFNNVRRRTGEHMVASKAIAPHALTVVEVDYEGVNRVRTAHKAAFKSAEGFSLTFLPFIVRAVVDALAEYPHLNASVEGDGIRVHQDLNIGVAVDLDGEGLIVPVIRQADGMRLIAVARSISDLAQRARSKNLGVDDISGGTFTLSNNGSFGTLTTAAIINQPQVAVLSTEGVSRKPVVVDDGFGGEAIAIHSVGNLAMAWDHRAFDGGYAASFLRTVKNIIETRDWSTEL